MILKARFLISYQSDLVQAKSIYENNICVFQKYTLTASEDTAVSVYFLVNFAWNDYPQPENWLRKLVPCQDFIRYTIICIWNDPKSKQIHGWYSFPFVREAEVDNQFREEITHILGKVLKNGPSKIWGRQPSKKFEVTGIILKKA